MSPSPPREAKYINPVRAVISCQDREKEFHDKAVALKREAATHMQSVGVTEFEVSQYDRPYKGQKNRRYSVSLERPIASRVSPRKLYTLLANQEITLEDFLDCITVSEKKANELLGDDISYVKEEYRKGLDLVIEEVPHTSKAYKTTEIE